MVYIIVIVVLIAVFLFIEHRRDKKELDRLDEVVKEERKAKADHAEKQAEATKAKQKAHTCDHARDSEFIAQRMHDLAHRNDKSKD